MIIFGMIIEANPANHEITLYFKNHEDAPFVCWNSCLPIKVTKTRQ